MGSLLDRARSRRESDEDREDTELRQEAQSFGCTAIAAQGERPQCKAHGVVRAVTVRPAGDAPALEVELYDGSDTVTLVWLGRCSITGVGPGRKLTAWGRFGRRGNDRVMYNPRYQLEA